MQDRGVYKCIASNLIGYGNERTIKVSVRCKNLKKSFKWLEFVLKCDFKVPPKIDCQRAVGQAPNFEVDAYMECYVYGYPPPRLRQDFFFQFWIWNKWC